MRFYLSGAISKASGGMEVADLRFASAFRQVAKAFKLANPENEIFNPASAFKQYRGVWTEPQFLDACFEVLPHCPILILIKDEDGDYRRSVGVKAELDYHKSKGGLVLSLDLYEERGAMDTIMISPNKPFAELYQNLFDKVERVLLGSKAKESLLLTTATEADEEGVCVNLILDNNKIIAQFTTFYGVYDTVEYVTDYPAVKSRATSDILARLLHAFIQVG